MKRKIKTERKKLEALSKSEVNSEVNIPSTPFFNPRSALQCMVNTLKPKNAWGLES